MLKQPTEAEVVQSQQLGVLLDAWRSRAAWSRRVDSEAPKFMPIGSADHAGGSFWSTPLPPTLQSGPNDHSDEVLRQMLTGALTSPRSAISPAPFDEHHQREQFNHQREQFDHQREHLQREQFEHHHSQRDHHEHQHHMQQQQQYQHRPSHHHLQGPPPQLWQQQRNSWVCPATSAEMSHASIADAITDTYPQRCASRSFDSMPSQLPEMRFVHQHRRLDDWSQGLHDPMMPPMSRMEAEMQRDACEHQRMMQQQQQRAMRRVGRRERAPPMGLNEASTAFELDLDRISTGSDQRTTLMVRNIPNKYTQVAVLEEIDALFQNCYDCFYLPIDFKNKCNVGYAFINLVDFRDIPRFFQEFDGRRWSCYRSAKVCAITYARIQGKASMIARFQNSNLMHESIEVQPRLFRSFGPGKGLPEEFPELG
ncbi:RNA recognition motif 2-domain-containing protein [Pelagophyceae sp. CCMP2097]|nr:RNA recognition motif 2-domain-containing protein [Pelagophyceae sp. CCMP2097]